MRKLLTLTTVVVLLYMLTLGVFAAPSEPRKAVILFEGPIGSSGQRLVITREADRDPQRLLGFWAEPGSKEAPLDNVYEIRMQLETPDEPNMVLASFIRCELESAGDYRGIDILDVLVERRLITVVTAEGYALRLWQVDGLQGLGRSLWVPQEWRRGAAMLPANRHTVSAHLHREADGRLAVDVVELAPKFATQFVEAAPMSLEMKQLKMR